MASPTARRAAVWTATRTGEAVGGAADEPPAARPDGTVDHRVEPAIRPTPLELEPDHFLTPDGLIARRVAAGTSWFRLHRAALGPLYFGGPNPGLRFNDPGPGAAHPLAPPAPPGAAPDASSYRVCYFGRSPETAFVEVFFRRLPSVAVAWSELAARALAEVRLAREVTLVCLAGPGLLRLGVSADVVAGRDYAPAQAVARGLWRHPARFDGLEYPTRHDTGERSVALFDRAQDAVPADAVVHAAALDPRGPLVAAGIRRYGFPVFDDR